METSIHTHRLDDYFSAFASIVRAVVAATKPPYFTTSVPNLYEIYLSGFSDDQRQTHRCHACRRFIEQYGGLVVLDEEGHSRSLFWSADVPEIYRRSVAEMRTEVEHASAEDVFYSEAADWGTVSTFDKKRGLEWTHFAVSSPQRFHHPLKTAGQMMAERREELGMLARGLGEFSYEVVTKAKALLESEQLYRSEKTLGVATWLLALHNRIANLKNRRLRHHILLRAVATAPAGFCHVKSTMIGTLLEDLSSDLPFETTKRRFAEKMHPLQYQRAQAAPTDANIAEAEKIVAKLGTAGALARRFAKLEDVQALWKPWVATLPPPKGVFGHLKAEATGGAETIGGIVSITWEKFARTVLPNAEQIEFKVPAHGSFIALVTAANPDAPPMLQWDRDDRRNPVSWYLYHSGSFAKRWNLKEGWCEVSAITLLPSMWRGEDALKHQGEGAILILKDARDTEYLNGGGFFTESLKSEYHAVRRTLEAYTKSAVIVGKDEATACGYDLRKGVPMYAAVRVTVGGLRQLYSIDRWD